MNTVRTAPLTHQTDSAAVSVDGAGVASFIVGGAVDALCSEAAIIVTVVISIIARPIALPIVS
ncbi:MAG: hypothetical protein AAB401_05575, partial [Acidobacteriota bacterium]